ncbi:MAG: hypothetical protein WAM60_09870, partial [Candidatus Promineifilaceae bacterium]
LALEKAFHLRQRAILLVGILAGLLIYIDYAAVPFPNRSAEISPFYTDYLDKVPNDVALAILPTGRQEDKWYMYYQTIHQHPMTNGVVSRLEAETFHFIRTNPLLRAGSVNLEPVPIPDNVEDSFRLLAENNVGFLVLDKALMEESQLDLEAWRKAIPFEPVYEDAFVLVYETSPNSNVGAAITTGLY